MDKKNLIIKLFKSLRGEKDLIFEGFIHNTRTRCDYTNTNSNIKHGTFGNLFIFLNWNFDLKTYFLVSSYTTICWGFLTIITFINSDTSLKIIKFRIVFLRFQLRYYFYLICQKHRNVILSIFFIQEFILFFYFLILKPFSIPSH